MREKASLRMSVSDRMDGSLLAEIQKPRDLERDRGRMLVSRVMSRMRDISFDELPGTPISDQKAVRALLIQAAKERRVVSYAELLMELGHRFTRPKMRALCRTLDAIDEGGGAAGEPELAALVVRESDR